MTVPSHPQLKIQGGRLIDPRNSVDQTTDVYVADGRVAAIGKAPDGFRIDQTVDAGGLIVAPGLIDLCTRLREPGLEHKATIESECRAAAASGITTLVCPPDTDPVIDTPAVVELIRHRTQLSGGARVMTIGALTRQLDGETLSEMAALKAAGCVGVGNAKRPLATTLVSRRTLEYAATFGLTVFISPSDHSLAADGCLHEGEVSTRLGLPGIPEAAETVAVARDLALVEQTGGRVHFCQVTTRRAVRMIARARFDGVPVSADVALPYLYFTDTDAADFDPDFHLMPPLRSQNDREGLHTGLAEGTLSAICSDHQPHEPDAKLAPFPSTEPGISGLDTLLPMTLHLVDEGILPIGDALARLTCGPAAILQLSYGHLAEGSVADICIFDPAQIWRLTPVTMHSAGKNTPWLNWEMKGKVRYTLRDGELIFTADDDA
jgi:dihydroorotase